MSNETGAIAHTVLAMRPMVPARDFEISKRFYTDLEFESKTLTQGLVEMRLGACSFLLQDYYVKQWADNFVLHLTVSDVGRWWDLIVARDIASRYGVKASGPQVESWGLAAAIVDPSGVLWRISEIPASVSPSDKA